MSNSANEAYKTLSQEFSYACNQISFLNVALNYMPYGAPKNRKFDYKKQKARLRKNKAQRKARKISNHK